MHPKPRNARKCRLIIGCILLTIGCTLALSVPWLIDSITTSLRTLKSDGKIFEIWQKTPVPLYFEYYLFNWTNPEDIYNLEVKPRFEEIGPFVFRSTMEKVNITWNSNETVTYRSEQYWYFEEAKSVANLSMKIYTVNAVAISGAYQLRFWSYVMKKGLDFSLRTLSQKLYVERTVGELIFDGYSDPLLSTAKSLPISKIITLPFQDKFAWFYQRNGSTFDGTFNVGTSDRNLGKLYQWNYASETSYYSGSCNKIMGSAGEFYPVPLLKDSLTFFWPEICRSLVLDYDEQVVVNGISGYKYSLGNNFLDNGTRICKNLCYNNGIRTPSGVFNVSTCKYGAPGFMSLPHFYRADPYYVDKVRGLNPQKSKHEMFAIREPLTGVPLHIEARFQLNLLLQPIEDISLFEKVPTVYMPVMWIECKSKLPGEYTFLLKMFLRLSIILYSLAAGSIALGVLLIALKLRDNNWAVNSYKVKNTEYDLSNTALIKLPVIPLNTAEQSET